MIEGQNSGSDVTTSSGAYYSSTGVCKCNDEGVLYYENAAKAAGIAYCGLNAEWIGCESVQCWSGKRANMFAAAVLFGVSLVPMYIFFCACVMATLADTIISSMLYSNFIKASHILQRSAQSYWTSTNICMFTGYVCICTFPAPKDVTAAQLNFTATASKPFNCLYSGGFPVTSIKYRIEDVVSTKLTYIHVKGSFHD